MNLFESILLGIIQGLTEFLPVSSSGHIELGKALLGVHIKDPLLFSIVVHAATALSTIVVYRKDIAQITLETFRPGWNHAKRFVLFIIISMIPVGLVGYFWESEIEAFFDGRVIFVGVMLLFTGLLLWFSSRYKAQDGPLTGPKAFLVGLAQAVAILPGISRSGSTISASLMLGVSREEAARFSFLMVLPPILGATLLKVKDHMELQETVSAIAPDEISTTVLVAGFLAAFIAGLFACSWMIALVKRSKLDWFAIYCWVVGSIAIVAGLLR